MLRLALRSGKIPSLAWIVAQVQRFDDRRVRPGLGLDLGHCGGDVVAAGGMDQMWTVCVYWIREENEDHEEQQWWCGRVVLGGCGRWNDDRLHGQVFG